MSRSTRRPRDRANSTVVGDSRPRDAGFTLIEVLVALAIALLALGTVYRMSSTGLKAGTTAERYSHALLIAEAALEAVGIGEVPQIGEFGQQVDGAYDRTIRVRPRPDLLPVTGVAPLVYPYEVAVHIAWHDGGRTRTIDLSTIRLGPPR